MVAGQELGQSKRVVVSHNVDRALKEGRLLCFPENVSYITCIFLPDNVCKNCKKIRNVSIPKRKYAKTLFDK